MIVEARLEAMGLILPDPPTLSNGQAPQFAWARAYGDRVYLSGHTAQNPDGSFIALRGKVGAEVTFEQAQEISRFAALSVLASLKRSIGDLDRVSAWLAVSGMVNVAPGFINTTGVIDGFSNLIVALFGEAIGTHARTAVGVSQLPLNSTVVVSAEVALLG